MKRLLLGLSIIFASWTALAQNTGTGTPPFGSFTSGTPYDVINNQNVNTHVGIPFVGLAGRGTSFSFSQVNDSQIWKPVTSGGTISWTPVVDLNGNPTWGWQTISPNGRLSFVHVTTGQCLIIPGNYYIETFNQSNYKYSDAQGTQHPFPGVTFTFTCDQQNHTIIAGGNPTGYAGDVSGYYVDASIGVVSSPDGIRYSGDSVKDTNGNYIQQYVDGNGKTSWTDTTGSTALTATPTSTSITYQDRNNNVVATVNLQTLNIKTNFGCSGVVEYSGTATVPSSIAFPNSQAISFSYEPTPGNTGYSTGRLQKVTFPNGGFYEYDYTGANDGMNCADGTILGMVRKISDGTGIQTWTFSRSGSTTTVTAPKLSYDSVGNDTVYGFDASGHENSRKLYEGSASSGTLLRTINTTWASNGTPATSVTVLEDRTTQSEIDTTYNSNGLLQANSQYDFGSGARGPLIKQTSYSYLADSNSNYAAPRNMISLISEVKIQDATGAVKSRAQFRYDETALAQSACPTGIAQHDDANYGCSVNIRGNTTSVTTYKDPVTPGNPITRSLTYDVFGNTLTAQVNCCQQKTWAFSSTTNYSYPDSITSGAAGGPQLKQSYTYNGPTDGPPGFVKTFTDENGQVTQYAYDVVGRIQTVTKPDNTAISNSYDDTNHIVTIQTPIDSTHSAKQIKAADALGRLSIITTQDSGGIITPSNVQKQYDELGRLSGTSNPYTGSTPSFFTTSRFDALGRLTQTILPDGQKTIYSYALQSITVTDPTGKQIRRKSDAAGRLVEVDEPNTSLSGTSSTASVTINGGLQSIVGAGSTPGLPATRIQTSGGSSKIKYFFSIAGPSQNGVGYSFSVTVRNQGSAAVKLAGNFVDGPVIQPGTTQSVSFIGMGNGVDIAQLLFETLNVGDAMDVVALAPSIAKASDGINLIPVASQNFSSGWSAWSGAVVTLTQGQTVPATRIQSNGGSSNIKYFFSVGGPSQNGVGYSFSVTVRNQGTAAVKLAGNFVDGPIIQPGTTQSISFTGIGDGVDIAQLLFETLNIGDAMDVIAFAPAIVKASDGINLIPASSQNFSSGWSAWSGAVVTLTQGQTVPATRIQTSGGSSNIKYFFSVGGPSQNGVGYSFSVTVRNQGSAAVKLAGNFVDGPVIQPGMMQSVNFTGTGDGVDIAQLLFETLNPGDAMDVVAFAPAIAKVSDGINLIPAASQNFSSGWSAWSGAVVTLTQGRTDFGTSDAIYDAGTSALTMGSFTATTCFGNSTNSACSGQPINTTAAQVASALASAINVAGSPATATVSGTAINLVWKTGGNVTASVSALTTTHDLPIIFSNPSFNSAATAFGGGSWLTNSPNITTYSYSVLDQIVSISQGSQTRTINYDALGRETSEITPEAGAVIFVHNDFGLATQRTDNRGVVTTYTYDQLNRMTGKSFPTVPTGVAAMPNNICDPASPTGTNLVANSCFYYDQGGASAFALGRLTKVVDPSGSESYAYDQLGRITQKQKTITGTNSGNPYTIQYQFNLASEITQIQYPSGRQVKPTFDALGRISGIADTMGGTNTTYASGFQYTAAQQLAGFTYGNGVVASYGFSADRLQLSSLSYTKSGQTLFGLSYGYSQNGGNGGDISTITDTVDNGRSLTYLYDALGRLQQASTAGSTNFPKWDLVFGYDRYGNRLAETPQSDTSPNVSVPSNSLTVDAVTNRINTSGYTFDASGNMTNDGINTLIYDGENRVSTSSGVGGTGIYVYDAAGKRVRKCLPNCASPTSSTAYIFSGHSVIAEYDNNAASSAPSREYINSTRGLLATIDSTGTRYHMRDHLSVRMTTDAGGNKINEQGHFPYGESWYSGSATTKWVFTNYERDPESGNDYAQARVYVNRSGRFSSPDPFSGASVFPQSLNRYVYATDDPINFIDPSGLVTCWETWQVTWVWNDDPGVWEVKSTVLVDWGCALDPSDLEPSGSSGGAGGGPGDSPPVNLRALFDCIMNLFGINGLSFKPSEPGKFGAFVGEGDANGDFTIYNNDTKYNRGTLTYMAKRVPGNEWIPENGVHGRTSPSNPYENYTARDATSLVDTQIYELGNSLAFITGTVPEKVDMRPGPNNNEPGNLLLKCVKNGGPFPLSSQQ